METNSPATTTLLLLNLVLPWAAGLGLAQEETRSETNQPEDGREVLECVAVLYPTKGHRVHGTVVITQVAGNPAIVDIALHGLEPRQIYQVDIHEFGDLSKADGSSTGEHFLPQPPAGEGAGAVRYESLGVIEADETGIGKSVKKVRSIRLGGPGSVLGRAVVVHPAGIEPEIDDLPRHAHGVIGLGNPEGEALSQIETAERAVEAATQALRGLGSAMGRILESGSGSERHAAPAEKEP